MSNQFEIAGPHLVFTNEPAEAGVGGPLRYKITLKNSKNNTVSNSNDFVEFTLNPVGDATGTLSSVSDILSFGVADNSDRSVSISNAGTYTLTATLFSDSTMAPVLDGTTPIAVTSKEFKIVANKLVFKEEPLPAFVNKPLHYKVELENYKGDVVTTGADQLNVTLNPVGGASAFLGTDTLVAGIANNTGANQLFVDATGSYSLTVVDVPANPSDPVATMVMSHVFRVIQPRQKA